MDNSIFSRLNALSASPSPFLFAINYLASDAFIRPLADIDPAECLYSFRGRTNAPAGEAASQPLTIFRPHPEPYDAYLAAFNPVVGAIRRGDSYLVNLTRPVPVECNLSLRDIFLATQAKFKLYVRRRFVCFSPEPFVSIADGRISSFPMKGTISADLPDAEARLLSDPKEAAEHATIVDLIRNDLSQVASHVSVARYRYVERLSTTCGDILQTSSHITGTLDLDPCGHLGDILRTQLPAGSITGAPKPSTMRIISGAEAYSRGFYTGVMGIFCAGRLDSAVMIRFIEPSPAGGYVYKAGGGITSRSNPRAEYSEVVSKTYLPLAKPSSPQPSKS